MNSIISFSSHQQISLDNSSHNHLQQDPTIKDYYNDQHNYSIAKTIDKLEDNYYRLIPIQDHHTILRAIYITILTSPQYSKRLQYLELIENLISKINFQYKPKNLQNVKLQYVFLYKLNNLKIMVSQMLELWKKSQSKSIFQITNNYPIIDQIIIASIRMILASLGYQKALDLSLVLQFLDIYQTLRSHFFFQQNLINTINANSKSRMDKNYIGNKRLNFYGKNIISIKVKLNHYDSQFLQQYFQKIVDSQIYVDPAISKSQDEFITKKQLKWNSLIKNEDIAQKNIYEKKSISKILEIKDSFNRFNQSSEYQNQLRQSIGLLISQKKQNVLAIEISDISVQSNVNSLYGNKNLQQIKTKNNEKSIKNHKLQNLHNCIFLSLIN